MLSACKAGSAAGANRKETCPSGESWKNRAAAPCLIALGVHSVARGDSKESSVRANWLHCARRCSPVRLHTHKS